MGTRFENLNVAGLTTVGIKMNLKDMESENDIPDIITYLLRPVMGGERVLGREIGCEL